MLNVFRLSQPRRARFLIETQYEDRGLEVPRFSLVEVRRHLTVDQSAGLCWSINSRPGRPEKTIEELKAELMNLGPMLPGSISEQWNVCGTAGCKCKDPDQPIKHGPYYQLSFSVKGKSSTLFIKKPKLREARKRVARYQRFKEMNMALVQAYVDLARQKGLSES